MPASVSKSAHKPDPTNTPAPSADVDSAASTDAEKKIARAARSAERLAQLTAGTTPDLFADDIERATLQAMNTDIRQGTLAGFELPEVFMAAVASGACSQADSAIQTRRGKTPDAEQTQPDDAQRAFDMALEGFDSPPSVDDPDRQDDPAPTLLAVALPEDDHRSRKSPDIESARAAAFADTIDALYAVTADQRVVSSAHTRRMKTMLTIIVCAMLATVATGIAQTLLLVRMNRDSVLQQNRIEQLMLNQEATLSSLFDTDSDTISTMNAPNRPRDFADASPVRPVSAARSDIAPKKHANSNVH